VRPFESQGLWYLPETPKDLVAGTLTYSVDDGLILKLTGTLKEATGPIGATNYPVIHGFVRDSPYGRRVTLVDCFQRRSTFAIPGFASEEVRANRAYVGAHHLTTEAESVFTSFRARYASLGEWTRLSGLRELSHSREKSHQISVHYREPEPLRFGVDGHALLIEAGAKWVHGSDEFSITEKPYITIDRLHTAPREALHTFVHPFQDFLTFASDRAIAIEEIAFFGDSKTTPEPVHLIFQPIYRQDPDSSQLSYTDMLFTWPDIAQSHSDIVEKWLRFRREFQSACDVFFGIQYAPPAFVEMRFLLSTIALGLILPRQVGSSGVHLSIERLRQEFTSERDRRWLDILPTEPELSLPWTAFAFVNEYRELLRPVVGEDVEAFITHIVDTRHHLFHRGIGDRINPDKGLRLWQLSEKTGLLVKIAILNALGFSRDEIVSLVSHSRRYLSLVS